MITIRLLSVPAEMNYTTTVTNLYDVFRKVLSNILHKINACDNFISDH